MTVAMLSSVCIVSASFWGICCGFVLLSSGASAVPDVYPPGGSWSYGLASSLQLKEKGGGEDKSVGFYVEGRLLVRAVWGDATQRLLEAQLLGPRLHVRSRKSPDAEGYAVRPSKLDDVSAGHFLVHWNGGKIEKVLLPKDDLLANLKKGIAGALQFQPSLEDGLETDASGSCFVRYKRDHGQTFEKTKENCSHSDLPFTDSPEPLLRTVVESTRTARYTLSPEGSHILETTSVDLHALRTAVHDDIGSELRAEQTLTLKDSQQCETFSSLLEAIDSLGSGYTQETLTTELETPTEDPKFATSVNNFREYLQAKSLGTVRSAKAFVHLVRLARKSTREDISKALASKKNQPILHQLYDVLGFVQTYESHEAAMKKLHFDKASQEELSERYLWALAVCASPNPDVLQDLLQKYRGLVSVPRKVKETMLLTMASMARRLGSSKAQKLVEEAIVNELNVAKGEERYAFLRALKNLRSKTTLEVLLEVAAKGTPKEGVYAWKAILAQEPSNLDGRVYKAALRTFYQLDKKQDSSSRTLAVDLLLKMQPSEGTLNHLLSFLKSSDPSFEVKQYVLQRIKMLAEEDGNFGGKVKKIIANDASLNNYHTLAQKGLSTALARSFQQGSSVNGTLLTIQEMKAGIVKRGTVDVVLSKDLISQEIFSLGIFSGGLGSFLSSDPDGDDETATAGMDLTILGNQIRPFVFFSGQGELMGHVWSGTASERTTAFQALALLQDHHQFVRLSNGLIAEMDVKGAASFDLSGSIQFSLWNRNGEALVEKTAGILLSGTVKVDTGFIRTFVDFSGSLEPKLQLNADIDFSSDVMLCLRLQQPEVVFRRSVHKVERVLDGGRHKFRMAKYQKTTVPGRTYALNRKNSNMCAAMVG